ncbi:MAG: glycosyltransferase family 9 protein [Chloroflexota bacterium]|nr:glycosyltransferase family 9 protein [Chloroflexota bacterium]
MPGRIDPKMLARELLVRIFCQPQALRNRLARQQDKTEPVKRILVIRPDHLGDLLFATPTLAHIRQAFPAAHITGLVGPWGRAMWEGNPNLDTLDVVRFPGIVERVGGAEPYMLLARSAAQIARGNYDLGIALRFDHWWGAALMWAAGVPRRWGYDTPGMQSWLTNRVPHAPGKHEVEQDLRLADAMIRATGRGRAAPLKVDRARGQPPLTPPSISEPPQELLDSWLAASEQKRVVIHPGTAGANKLWTIKGWSEVADRLSAEGYNVILTGAPNEQVLCARIVEASNSKPLDLSGRTRSISELTWILDKAYMVLGVDSGPLHIADALGKRTLHLYGPSDERSWAPWGDPRLHRALRAPGTHPTAILGVDVRDIEGGPEMRAITVEMVMREIAELRR